MARRNRRSTRAAPRTSAAERQVERGAERREIARESARAGARRTLRVTATRASGAPTAVMERSAALERAFVVKDSRRLTITTGVMLALLVVSGFVVNTLFP